MGSSTNTSDTNVGSKPSITIIPISQSNEGRVRAKDMADVYDGFGEGRMGSPRSPTRPHTMRRRQSMQVIELEARVEQLSAEKKALEVEKEEMIRSHSLETEELRKKISYLTGRMDGLISEEGRTENRVAQNISLKTRASELEVTNDELQGRITQLEQNKQNVPNDERMHQDSKEIQRIFRDINTVIVAVTNGDVSQKIAIQPREINSDIATLKTSINTLVDHLNVTSHEVSGIAREIGREGLFGGQAVVPNASGLWKEMIENVNQMAETMTTQIRSMSISVRAIGQGDFTKKVTEEFSGESLVFKEIINHTIDALGAMVADINKNSEVVLYGGEFKAHVRDGRLKGRWALMVSIIDLIASNLTAQNKYVLHVANCVLRGEVSSMSKKRPPLPTTGIAQEKLREMADDLERNWIRRVEEVEKEDHDIGSQQEKLQRIWTILQSNI